MNTKISWWRTSFGEEEIQRIGESIRNECVSQGKVTAQFEQSLAEFLEVEHVIATAHDVHLLDAKVVPVDVELDRRIIVAE